MTRAERVEPAAGTEPAAARVRAHPSPALRRRRRGRALLYVAAVLLSLWVLVPTYLITVTAFTPRRAIFDFPKPVVPRQVSAETVSFFAHSSGVLAALVTLVVVALMHTALALPFTVLVTSSIFVTVPRELEEAARTLGCTPLGAFVRVVLPLALPGLAAAGIFTWELSWNEVFAATILTLDHPSLPALVISTLQGASLPFRFAAAWFMLAPALAGIFLIRRYLLGLWGRVGQ